MSSIGELSKRTDVNMPTIRYYEQSGVLAPELCTEGNQRRYVSAESSGLRSSGMRVIRVFRWRTTRP